MKIFSALFAIVALVAVIIVISPKAEAEAKAGKTAPVKLTAKNFTEQTASGVVLIDFWAEWCGPCKAIAPVIDELARDYQGKALVAKVDVDSNPELAQKFSIRNIPNLKIMKDGKVVDEIIGVVDKKTIERKLNKHL